jgi:hypothetical protein
LKLQPEHESKFDLNFSQNMSRSSNETSART